MFNKVLNVEVRTKQAIEEIQPGTEKSNCGNESWKNDISLRPNFPYPGTVG